MGGFFFEKKNEIPYIDPKTRPLSYQKKCLKMLYQMGWTRESKDYTNQPLLRKNELLVRILFGNPKEWGSLTMRQDWAEIKSKSSVPVVVVMYENPEPISAQYAADLRVIICNYTSLNDLDELIRVNTAKSPHSPASE